MAFFFPAQGAARPRRTSRARAGVLTAGVLVAASVAGFAVTGVPMLAGSASAVAAGVPDAAVIDPLAVLAGRSPGGRAPGALYQTKPDLFVSVPDEPFAPPAAPSPYAGLPPAPPPAVPVPLNAAFDVPFMPPLDVAPGLPFAPFLGGFGGPPFVGLWGGGFPSLPGGGGGIPAPNPPVTSAVPEPSTWLMLVLGFGVIGATLRRAGRPDRAGA